MRGDKESVRNHSVAAGALHPGGKPGVLDSEIGHRNKGPSRLVGLDPAVEDRNAADAPVGMPAARSKIPTSADQHAAIGGLNVARRNEPATQPRFDSLAENVLLQAMCR